MSMQGDWQPSNSPVDASTQHDAAELADRDQEHLLLAVLSETLAQLRSDPAELLNILRQWRATLRDPTLEQEVCQKIVSQVFRHRLGETASELPEELPREIGAALWNDPISRQRISRLWAMLGATR